MSPARLPSGSSPADGGRLRAHFARAVAAQGVRPVLGALACAAASHRGLTDEPGALRALTGSALFDGPLASLPAELCPLAVQVALEPGRLGELSAGGLATVDRKRRGVFYTPAWVAGVALDRPTAALAPEADALVLDPACGGGRFLLAAFDRLALHLPAPEAIARLRGLDTDPLAVAVARAALYLRAASRPGEALPVARIVDVGDFLSLHGTQQALSGFSAVIGNPPYRGGRFAPMATLGTAGLGRFATAEYQVDPYVLFIEAGLAALRPGGRLALVVPNAFMSNLRAGALRRVLAEQAEVTALIELPPATFGAGVETVILRVTTGAGAADRVPVFKAKRHPAAPTGSLTTARPEAPTESLATAPDGEMSPSGTLLVSRHPPGGPWPLLRGDEDAPTHFHQTLDLIGEVTRGINPYHHTRHRPEEIARRIHHADHAAGPDFSPELRGRDLRPFQLAWSGRRWVRYGPWLKEPRDPRFFVGPRLLVRKILGPTLIAAYTDAPFYCDQSVYIIKLRPGQPWPPLALLACVGSRFLAELLRARHQEHDTLFPQLKVAELRGAPLPPVSPNDPDVISLADQMAAHVAGGAPEAARGPIDAAVSALYHRGAPIFSPP